MNGPASATRLPPGLRLQPLRAAELGDYKALRDAMIAAHEDAFTSDAATEQRRSADSYRSRLGRSADGDGACLFTLCAWQGRRLVGALSCELEPRVKLRHVAHLVGMMVHDDCQGQGIGQALLEAALRLLRQEPALEQVLLSVTRSNSAAVRLYQRIGFERYGRLPQAIKLPDGSHLDKDLMRLPLRPALATDRQSSPP